MDTLEEKKEYLKTLKETIRMVEIMKKMESNELLTRVIPWISTGIAALIVANYFYQFSDVTASWVGVGVQLLLLLMTRIIHKDNDNLFAEATTIMESRKERGK